MTHGRLHTGTGHRCASSLSRGRDHRDREDHPARGHVKAHFGAVRWGTVAAALYAAAYRRGNQRSARSTRGRGGLRPSCRSTTSKSTSLSGMRNSLPPVSLMSGNDSEQQKSSSTCPCHRFMKKLLGRVAKNESEHSARAHLLAHSGLDEGRVCRERNRRIVQTTEQESSVDKVGEVAQPVPQESKRDVVVPAPRAFRGAHHRRARLAARRRLTGAAQWRPQERISARTRRAVHQRTCSTISREIVEETKVTSFVVRSVVWEKRRGDCAHVPGVACTATDNISSTEELCPPMGRSAFWSSRSECIYFDGVQNRTGRTSRAAHCRKGRWQESGCSNNAHTSFQLL